MTAAPVAYDSIGREFLGDKALVRLARREAQSSGGRYYHGTPCHCGSDLRYTKGGNCVRCKRAESAARRQQHED